MQRRKGFTLAEVLITLSIIGVVAALTIPAIVGSTNKARAVTSVKKAVSVLNQALTMSVAQDGLSANSVTGASGNSLLLKTIFQNYLSTLNSNDVNANLTTPDGMIYTFFGGTTGCKVPANNDPNTDAANATCLVEVDINGSSGSSIAANKNSYADLYYFIIRDNDVVPANAAAGWNPSTGHANFRRTSGTVDDVAQNALLN